MLYIDVSIDKLYFNCFIIHFFLLLRTENGRTKRNESERKFVPAIRSYQNGLERMLTLVYSF